MPEFKNAKLGVTFRVPDHPTVRQQLAYFSEAGMARGSQMFERLWLGALTLMEDWECELLPDPKVDLDGLTDPKVVQVLLWSGLNVEVHMNQLEEIPKVSTPQS